MKIGFIGLGKMGSRMVEKLISEGHEVVAWNRTWDTARQFETKVKREIDIVKTKGKLKIVDSIGRLVLNLDHPRIVWVMLPAGETSEKVLIEVASFLGRGDILIDGGNAFWEDTEKRFEKFQKKGILFLGIGVSGGIIASKKGYPLMAGGSEEGFEKIKPVLESLSKPEGGYEYFGKGGAGHFVKMVHNGIEYGIMQSLGEGFEVLKKSKYGFSLSKVAGLWQKGTLVSGFLLDRAFDALKKDETLGDVVGIVEESGEAQWTVDTAKKQKVNIQIIENSLEFRKRTQRDKNLQKTFTAKMLAVLRREFGGHSVKNK